MAFCSLDGPDPLEQAASCCRGNPPSVLAWPLTSPQMTMLLPAILLTTCNNFSNACKQSFWPHRKCQKDQGACQNRRKTAGLIMFACHKNFSAVSWLPAYIQEDALSSITKLLSRKQDLIQGHGRQQQQINLASNSPFPLGLPCLKQNGGAKPKKNMKNKNAALQPLAHWPHSCAFGALANSMQGLTC